MALAGAVLMVFALAALSPSLPASDPDVVVPLATTSGHPDAGEVTSARVVRTQLRTVAHHRTPPNPAATRYAGPSTPSRATPPAESATSPGHHSDPRVPRAPPRHD
jgi:hypothetical protein